MIDKEENEKLRAKFNPDGSPLRNYQMRLLEILKYIDKICRENNIKYWLSSGTCLGAVRHGGFIPWDDDADIEMFEDDYKHFLKIMLNMNHLQFKIQVTRTDPYYHLSYAKVRDLHSHIKEVHGDDVNFKYDGCFIDVFPIAPSNSKLLHYISRSILWRVKDGHNDKKRLKYRFWSLIKNITFPIFNYIDRWGNPKIYRHRLGHSCTKTRLLSDIKETIPINFEGYSFPVPNNYDGYLNRIYGNYMEIPNVNAISIHLKDMELSDE